MGEQNDPNVQVIENATRDDVRPGDHITWMCVEEIDSVTTEHHREGIAHHRDRDGDWRAKDEACITIGEGATLTIRRTAPELPTEPDSVIERAEGHKYITATVSGETYRARRPYCPASAGLRYGAGTRAGGRSALPVRKKSPPARGRWATDDRPQSPRRRSRRPRDLRP